MLRYNTLFTMTQERFNEIIRKCKKEVPDFMHKAKWGFNECKEPNSIEVTVTLTRIVAIGDKDIETHFSGKSLTQEEEHSIICAIMALNEGILYKM